MTSNKQQQEFSQNIKALNEKFTNYEQNQYDTSTISVQKNLNEIIQNLTDNYNQKEQIYKSTADTIKNHDIILSKRKKLPNKKSNPLWMPRMRILTTVLCTSHPTTPTMMAIVMTWYISPRNA